VTSTSETPAVAAARLALMRERQARVGILRNPNTPPRPPQRKARLTGKWPSLQSTRRPQTQPRPDTAPGVTDTDLARMMKEALAPVTPDGDNSPFDRSTAENTAAPPADSVAHPANIKAQTHPLRHALKPLVLLGVATALVALTLVAKAL